MELSAKSRCVAGSGVGYGDLYHPPPGVFFWGKLMKKLLVLVWWLSSAWVYAQDVVVDPAGELAVHFAAAKQRAEQMQGDSRYSRHTDAVLLRYFVDTYIGVLQDCAESLDAPDITKFDIVAVLDDNGKVLKVYRDLETNVGLCLFGHMEQDSFPKPLAAPFYLHIDMNELAGESHCPPETIENERVTPDISVVWCEVIIEDKVVLHGPYRAWWPNGQLGNDGYYEMGVPVGTWTGWYHSGVIQGINVYENGKLVKEERYPEDKGGQ